MEVHFVVAQEDGRSKKFRLTNEEYVVIGRSKTMCQVFIEDSICSSTHAKVSVINNAIFIEDLNSKNGVFLNGVKIIKQRIYVDDKVRFGNSILFINHSRMDQESISYATYTGKGSREGNLTLELDQVKSSPQAIKAIHRMTQPKPSDSAPQEKRRVSVTNKTKTVLVSQAQIKNAMLCDIFAAVLVFCLCNFVFYHMFTDDYIGSETTSVFIKMFRGKAIRYTVAAGIIGYLFHAINRKLPSGSIGKKIVGIS
ncbi:MAG: FHA domain-containing protein [Bdellovibrionota bacterium]|nr:FHA domain-containing protein [Bdellovibrionota bacterium]